MRRTVQPGQTLADALSTMGAPTGRHALADGAQRLEYATGPMGLHTWMVDVDAQGRVMTVAQVLSPPFFAQVQPGMARDDLLRLLGRPGERRAERGGGELWSWRFEGPFCLRLQVSLSARGQVREGAVQSPDPLCTPEQ